MFPPEGDCSSCLRAFLPLLKNNRRQNCLKSHMGSANFLLVIQSRMGFCIVCFISMMTWRFSRNLRPWHGHFGALTWEPTASSSRTYRQLFKNLRPLSNIDVCMNQSHPFEMELSQSLTTQCTLGWSLTHAWGRKFRSVLRGATHIFNWHN